VGLRKTMVKDAKEQTSLGEFTWVYSLGENVHRCRSRTNGERFRGRLDSEQLDGSVGCPTQPTVSRADVSDGIRRNETT